MYLNLKPPDLKRHLFLLSIVSFLLVASTSAKIETEFKDTVVAGKRTLTVADSPYVVKEDVLVEEGGQLVVEAGVTVRFMPTVGITVRGVLQAEGEHDKNIVFTSAQEPIEIQPNRTVRLVDGPTVNEGIIQVNRGLLFH